VGWGVGGGGARMSRVGGGCWEPTWLHGKASTSSPNRWYFSYVFIMPAVGQHAVNWLVSMRSIGWPLCVGWLARTPGLSVTAVQWVERTAPRGVWGERLEAKPLLLEQGGGGDGPVVQGGWG
jgi:hypothetical protein